MVQPHEMLAGRSAAVGKTTKKSATVPCASRHGDAADKNVDEGAGESLAKFMRLIAEIVVRTRAQRGLSRRSLAQQAGVSERYLSQIESASANMSLEKLWKIAEALGVEVNALIPAFTHTRSAAGATSARLARLLGTLSAEQHGEALELLCCHFNQPIEMQPKTGVAIIGLRGAGKSTLGRALAEQSGLPFYQTRQLIEQLARMPASEIFALGGQKTWRRLERQALEKLIDQRRPVVLETSGSLVSEAATFRLLRQNFHTVWVRCSARSHMQRVLGQGDTRVTGGVAADAAMGDLCDILVEREPLYRQADYQLDNSAASPEPAIAELISIAASLALPGDDANDH